jgi:hypothetical protein
LRSNKHLWIWVPAFRRDDGAPGLDISKQPHHAQIQFRDLAA